MFNIYIVRRTIINNYFLLFVFAFTVTSCAVGEAVVIDSDWRFKKNNKIQWGESNCAIIRDNEELQKLHGFVCPSFKTLVVDAINSGATGTNLYPRIGYYKKASEIYMQENKAESCRIIKSEPLIGKYDTGVKDDNYGFVFYYEC